MYRCHELLMIFITSGATRMGHSRDPVSNPGYVVEIILCFVMLCKYVCYILGYRIWPGKHKKFPDD